MIFVPFPSLQESVDYLPTSLLFSQTKWGILNIIKGGTLPEFIIPWTYHFYFLCEYGLLSIARMQSLKAPIALTSYLTLTYTRYQRSLLNLGPPEWWGNPIIHSSHKSIIDSSLYDNYNYYSTLPFPEVSLTKRLSSLQPLIRQKSKEKQDATNKHTKS